MTEPADQRVSCPGCGRGYRWQAALSGKEVTCKQCSEAFIVPNAPGIGRSLASGDGEGYEVHIEEENHQAPATSGKCPSCNSPVKPGAVLCMNCGFNMKEGRKMAAPTVEVLDAKERKEQGKELAGMKYVRVGLWLNMLSILLTMLAVVLPIAGLFAGFDYELIFNLLLFSSVGSAVVGSLLCLATPKESKARPILFISLGLTVIATIAYTMMEFGSLSGDLELLVDLIDAGGTACFLYFFVMLSRYLGFDQITERAEKVLGYYILMQIGANLLFLPVLGCVLAITVLGLAIYTLVLYILLLIDLNNALSYRIDEQAV